MNECSALREENIALTDANNGYVTDLKNSRDANNALIGRCQERENENQELKKRERKAAEKEMESFGLGEHTCMPFNTAYPTGEEFKVNFN